MSSTAESQLRDGSVPNDGPLGAPPGPSAETDRDAPSGMPEESPEAQPLGPEEARPESEEESPQGAEHMPGIPTGGEPPTAG